MSGTSPLSAWHASHGARFVDFGGWEMPVQYDSVIAEHRAVRSSVGFFDVSHLGRVSISGPGATAALRGLFCNDVGRVEPGRTQYTMLLNTAGGILDDIVVWRWASERYWVLPNAANHELVLDALRAQAPEAAVEDLRPSTVMLAVQGPEAPAALDAVLGWSPRRFRTAEGVWSGVPVAAAGTGYTGEHGGEVVIPAAIASAFADALVEAGATPCGLGARDTLRLEAGLPLWGNDLDPGTTPVEAGLEWVISLDHDFPGRDAIEEELRLGPRRRLVAFRMGGRSLPRHGYRLRAGDSTGVVTSGNFSPGLQVGIGLGYLDEPGTGPLEVEIRGSWLAAERASLPFVRPTSAAPPA